MGYNYCLVYASDSLKKDPAFLKAARKIHSDVDRWL